MSEKLVSIRCPACGKFSRLRNYAAGAKGDHVLEAGDHESLSRLMKRGGFEWTKRELTRAERQLLCDAIATVAGRLRLTLTDPERAEPEPPSTRQEALQYLLDAEARVRDAQAELEFRRREVDELFQIKTRR